MSIRSPLPASPIGIGVYSYADAARFIGAEPREVRRWMEGYTYKSGDGDDVFSPPLWDRELQQFGLSGIGLHDLLELRFVKSFRMHGVSLSAIRQGVVYAREHFEAERPFLCKRFQTDGRSIFATVLEMTGDETLIDVLKRQQTFREIVGPALYAGIEFDQKSDAVRWYPRKSKVVVLDRDRYFGQPILSKSGVPTVALASALKAEDDNVERVARMFDVGVRQVRQAADFEASLQRPH